MITATQKRNFCTAIGNTELLSRSISSFTDIMNSVNEVYNKPFTPRTVKNIEKLRGNHGIEGTLETFATKLFDYFHNNSIEQTQEDYNIFMVETCEWFVLAFNALAKERGSDCIVFGKAQKLFNMTIKYMACFSDSDKYENVFKYANMPVDSIMIDNLIDAIDSSKCENLSNAYNSLADSPAGKDFQLTRYTRGQRKGQIKTLGNDRRKVFNNITWSNLDNTQYKKIRSLVSAWASDEGCTQLELDFKYWL